MLYSSRDNSFKDRAVDLEARISIALDKVGLEFSADIKI